MSAFVATGSGEPDTEAIGNDGFFPDVALAPLRAIQRLDGTVTPERLAHEVTEAIISVNDELAVWRRAHLDAGQMTLDAVPADQVGNVSVLTRRYLRAVYCVAHAALIERYRNFDATASARKEADADLPNADELRRDARWAIRDLLGVGRTTVELI